MKLESFDNNIEKDPAAEMAERMEMVDEERAVLGGVLEKCPPGLKKVLISGLLGLSLLCVTPKEGEAGRGFDIRDGQTVGVETIGDVLEDAAVDILNAAIKQGAKIERQERGKFMRERKAAKRELEKKYYEWGDIVKHKDHPRDWKHKRR